MSTQRYGLSTLHSACCAVEGPESIMSLESQEHRRASEVDPKKNHPPAVGKLKTDLTPRYRPLHRGVVESALTSQRGPGAAVRQPLATILFSFV